METHVERPKAQRRVEDLSSAHTLRPVSVGRLRGFAIGHRREWNHHRTTAAIAVEHVR